MEAMLSSPPPVDNNNVSDAITPRQAFFHYMHKLEHSPRVDMRVFPRTKVLVLDGVPPTWIVNLSFVQPTLQVLTVHRAAIYHLPSLFFSRYDMEAINRSKKEKQQHGQAETSSSSSLLVPSSGYYPHLTHLKLVQCNLGERSGLVATLSKLESVQYLSLQHNEIRSEQTALRALRRLPRLMHVDLRDNCLTTSLPHAYLYLGGQLSVLKLSHNHLTNVRGLDRCYALQELWLDGNAIPTVQDAAGLARLPELTYLRLHHNPCTTLGNPNFDPDWRVQLWIWFQEHRRATSPLELPVLVDNNMNSSNRSCSGGVATTREWAQILDGSFSNVATTTTTTDASTITVGAPSTGTSTEPATPSMRTVHVNDPRNSSIDDYAIDDKMPFAPGATAMPTTTLALGAAMTPSRVAISPVRLQPIRNRRVTKKGKTRRVNIQDETAATAVEGRQQSGIQRSSLTSRKDYRKHSSSDSPFHVTKSPSGSAEVSPPTTTTLMSYQHSGEQHRSLSFSLRDVLELLQETSEGVPSLSEAERGRTEEESLYESDQSSFPALNCHDVSAMESAGVPGKVSSQPTTTNPFDNDPACDTELPTSIFREEETKPFPVRDVSLDEISKVNETIHPALEIKNYDSCVAELKPTDPESASSDALASLDQVGECGNEEEGEQKHPSNEEGSQISGKQLLDGKVESTVPSPERIFTKPKVATIKLKPGATSRPYDVLNYDWDELIKRASAGLIPDGIPKVPLAILEQEIAKEVIKGVEVFPAQAADLLADMTESGTPFAAQSNQSLGASLSASDPVLDTDLSSIRLGTTLPEHVWKDDSSVLSSLGGSRDDFAINGYSKFQLAEENSLYDGPESCREMKVVENLKLYFESFVFPTSVPDVPQAVLEEMQVDDDDWQAISLYHPRIQLWPDDRRWLENAIDADTGQIADWTTNRERFVRLWEEDLIPCGKPALRRLPPNRRIRLGFHGEKLFEGANLDAYAECRKVVLCLSSKAFYVIVGEDDVTASHQQQAKKRRFPLPLDKDLSFRDAPWPHSVARHSLLDLEAVCIGFEFQRLTLRFRNPILRSSDPFVYTLLTSNKKSTVSILQEVQSLYKDLSECASIRSSKKSVTLAIENDSNHVFDALNLAVSPDPVGTIIHYQIVQQQWKHGDRGTVRRICVVSDTKILLLDEDYTADGHRLNTITVKGDHMADVSYRIVDEGLLKQISEVQAAGSDPKAITIIISPLSSLSRTHRWRLVCRDREGAERLVDDVRKALDIQKGAC
jgi:hypothetical protein